MIPALAIVAAVWIVLACLAASLPGCAYALGRFRARRRRRSYTNLITELPPVPAPKADWHWCDYGDCPSCSTPLVFPANVTLEELEQYATELKFAAIVCEEFPYERQRFQS